jgi:DNA-binding PadR family transcriptional regulator
VSPVFRHGRLRLYLLKLLDEAPRHGYEVIRLLQDRFMGVYAPSPGTIYPRLARLEEDGLVTHEEVDGKKIYSITDKGREEIRSRLGDLADLEDELTESLRDVAREISEDVRDTVRSIREELASAAREFRAADGGKDSDRTSAAGSKPAGSQQGQAGADRSDEAQRIRAEAKRSREQMRASFRAQGRRHGDWAAWQRHAGRPDWAGWTSWTDWASRTDWAAAGEEPEAAGDTKGAAGQGASRASSQADDATPGSGSSSRRRGPNPLSDLERIAIQFANELRAAAKQTGGLGERSLNDLRDILTDTLAKVRVEVFTDAKPEGETRDDAAHQDSPAAPPPDVSDPGTGGPTEDA